MTDMTQRNMTRGPLIRRKVGIDAATQAVLDDHAASVVTIEAGGYPADAPDLDTAITAALADLPTTYATRAAMLAAVGSLDDGHVCKLTGVSGVCCEVASGALVEDPLFVGVPIPGLSIGKDATNGYSDAQGTSVESGSGIEIEVTPASPTPDDAHGIVDLGGAGFWDFVEKITLPLPNLGDGEIVTLKGTVIVHATTWNSGNTITAVLGLFNPADPDTGVYARFGAHTAGYCSYIDVNNGTPTSSTTANTKNGSPLTAARTFTFYLSSSDYGRKLDVVVDEADGTDMAQATGTLSDAHAWVVHMQTATPAVELMFGVYATNNFGSPSSLKATLVDLAIWNPS